MNHNDDRTGAVATLEGCRDRSVYRGKRDRVDGGGRIAGKAKKTESYKRVMD
jgi:hypothetical protein